MQIEECDSILGAMETMLGKFQADLGNVSGEIRSLQVRQAPTQIDACHCAADLPSILEAAVAGTSYLLLLAISGAGASQLQANSMQQVSSRLCS